MRVGSPGWVWCSNKKRKHTGTKEKLCDDTEKRPQTRERTRTRSGRQPQLSSCWMHQNACAGQRCMLGTHHLSSLALPPSRARDYLSPFTEEGVEAEGGVVSHRAGRGHRVHTGGLWLKSQRV